MKMKHIVLIASMLGIVGWGSYNLLLDTSDHYDMKPKPIQIATQKVEPEVAKDTVSPKTSSLNKTIETLHSQASNLSEEVLKTSLTAYQKAEKMGLNEKHILTIVDYSLPSSQRRLWVIDMNKLKVLFNTWVAHGTNSGGATATSFSNKPSSLKSSFGVYLTEHTYTGGKGYSLRIKGLEHNINDNAYDRSIVFHGAWYVSSSFAHDRGMMGRSWGCFAVDKAIVTSLINTIKEKSLVVAYYPDKNWLKHSAFMN